jgi:hypothetical protein
MILGMEGIVNQASSLQGLMARQLSLLRLPIYPGNIKISKVSPNFDPISSTIVLECPLL